MRKIAVNSHKAFYPGSVQTQCFLYGKRQNPDYTVRNAIEMALNINELK